MNIVELMLKPNSLFSNLFQNRAGSEDFTISFGMLGADGVVRLLHKSRIRNQACQSNCIGYISVKKRTIVYKKIQNTLAF
jgi:hypothetical protein